MSDEDFSHAQYAHILEVALAADYRFLGFDALTSLRDGEDFVCALRHDCDNDLTAAVSLGKLEQQAGIRATYFIMLKSVMYNALSATAEEQIRDLRRMGHEIGLHVDASLCNGKRSLSDEVAFEVACFERIHGTPIRVVSFHQPSNAIIENTIGDIGFLNTYNPRHTPGFKYISDSSGIMRTDLAKMFRQKLFGRVHLNLHPEWWSANLGNVRDRWARMLEHGLDERQRELWQRENSFPQMFTVTLTPSGQSRPLPERMVYETF